MSGGADRGQQFDDLVNRSIEFNNKVHDMNKMLKQINMAGRNCNGTLVGIEIWLAWNFGWQNSLF